jgi:hypothetical protein
MKIRLLAAVFAVMGLFILMGPGTAWAQAPLSLGSVTGVTQLSTCPTYSASNFNSGTTCFTATVHACPNTVDLGFTYGEIGPGTSGTIVVFNGGAGNTGPGATGFVSDYVTDGYKVVQVVWNSAWELTGSGSGVSIKVAACRPSTVLNYVRQNIYTNASGNAGMCAQGSSAGSGAIGYALAEYGARAALDNVELLSGPVFGDIEKGCVVPNTPVVTVCPASQTYCNTGTEGGWPDPPQYIGGDITAINNWSGINACNGGTTTTTAQNTAWKQMSIVDGLGDSTFSYPQTAMAGWLCSNTSVSCGSQPCQNNSAAEGQYFYGKVTGSIEPFKVTRIDKCSGQEGVINGFLPPPNNTESGFTAILNDMVANCKNHH